MSRATLWRVLSCLLALPVLIQCGDDNAATTLSSAFPNGFSVASPTSTSSSRRSLRTTVTSTATRAEKLEILTDLFAASALADCGVSLNLLSGTNASCYGPAATFTNHPGGGAPGSVPSGDLGIWEAAETTTEGCAAAQLSNRMKGTASYADAGLFGTASLLCVARVTGAGVPAAGASVDLLSSMSGLITVNSSALTVTTATLAREADTTDGFPVFVSTLVGTVSTTTYTIRMKHIPTDASNATYRGKVSVKVAANDGVKPGNCSTSTATGNTIATSVAYEKASSTSEKVVSRDAQFCGHDADPFVSTTDFTVDLSRVLAGGTPKGWANNANLLAFEANPSTGVGNYAYAWQAGYGDSNTRALNLNLASASGTQTATAFFGFGDVISSSDGDITKMICNWAGPASSHTGITEAQKQVLTRSVDSDPFTVSSSNIVYDPVNSCEDGGATFQVAWTGVSGGAMNRTADTTTKNLVAVSTIASSFTTPTAPTAVE